MNDGVKPYQDNYYHFVVESLPRLIMARDIMLRDPSVQLLTRANKPFILQFLHMLGIPSHRIETLSHVTHVRHCHSIELFLSLLTLSVDGHTMSLCFSGVSREHGVCTHTDQDFRTVAGEYACSPPTLVCSRAYSYLLVDVTAAGGDD
jgi:hypothetical protein